MGREMLVQPIRSCGERIVCLTMLVGQHVIVHLMTILFCLKDVQTPNVVRWSVAGFLFYYGMLHNTCFDILYTTLLQCSLVIFTMGMVYTHLRVVHHKNAVNQLRIITRSFNLPAQQPRNKSKKNKLPKNQLELSVTP